MWLGDTIILDYKPSNNGSEVVYGEVDDWERWCLIDDYGVLHDKPSYNPRTNKALAGIYKLSNFSKITKAICNITKFEDTVNGEFQISQILEKCNNINQVKTTEWYDCGNFPSLYDTRAKLLNMLSRSDNYIWVDTTTGTITKSGKRCISEIEWYKDVPHNIKPFLPTVYDIDTEKNSYTMEYCPGTSLQDIFVFEQLKEDTIEYTLNKVLDTFDLCFTKQTSYKYRETSEASEYMWIEKNLQRFLDYNQYHFIEQDDLHYILNVVKSKSYKQIINDCNSINTIHGDLHFGNILFDYNIGKVKFIDPRGNWNNNDTLTGDIEYDIAKLYQSCYCEYMWIVNNLAINEVVKDKLVEILDSRFTNTRDHKIRACIMMASCLPFHNDNPVRQERIWNTSIRLLKELNIFED